MKKHTYKEWWDGKVYLETCRIICELGDVIGEQTTIIDYSIKDQSRIIEKQKGLFQEDCNRLLKFYTEVFNERYSNSELKEDYLEAELIDLEHLFNTPTSTGLRFHNRDFKIEQQNLIEMRRYFKEQILRGKKDYSFVHSPNYQCQPKNKISQQSYIYAHWLYWSWLKEFSIKVETAKKTSKGDMVTTSIPKRIPVPVIALIYLYKRIPISRINADSIAANYGYDNKKSGEGLFQDYCEYSKISIRIGLDDKSLKPNTIRLKYIETAIKHVRGEAKKDAEKDFKILKDLIDKYPW